MKGQIFAVIDAAEGPLPQYHLATCPNKACFFRGRCHTHISV